MIRLFPVLLVLSACGGGGAGGGPFDPVVRVRFADVPPPANALTYFDANGTRRIELDFSLRDDPYLVATLRHEMWHAIVGRADHNDDPACVSSTPAPSVFIACPVEAQQAIDSTVGGPRLFAFPEEPQIMAEAVFWWNWSCAEIVADVD